MFREPELIDFLSGRSPQEFAGKVYRITRIGHDPLVYSTAGGRWMARDKMAVLYTSLTRDGVLAEISFRLSQMTPIPDKPVVLHELSVEARKAIKIGTADFAALGIDAHRFGDVDYKRTQEVGDAIGFLEFDAMFVPSARWTCENLILLADHQDLSVAPEVVDSQEVDWRKWATANGFLL